MSEEALKEIKSIIKTDKIIIGTDCVIKGLRKGVFKIIYHASNTHEDVIADLKHYGKLSSTDIVALEIPNDELGVVCQKPFSISVLGILK